MTTRLDSSLLVILLFLLFDAFAILGLDRSALAASAPQKKAEAEGEVMWYCVMVITDCQMIADRFMQQHPKITVRFYRGSDAKLMERIVTEARAGRFFWDVVTITAYYGYLLDKRGMLAVYHSPERKYYRDGYKDPKGTWTSTYSNLAVLAYNSKLVAKEDIPKSMADLLDPRWKREISFVDNAYEWFAVTVESMGRNKGVDFMRRLAGQNPEIRTGRSLLAGLLAAGEFKIFLSSYSHNIEKDKEKGAPVDWIALNPVYGNLHPTAISSKASHPSAAQSFLDYLLSRQGQEILRERWIVPDRIDVPPNPPKLLEGIKAVHATPKIYGEFDTYIKLFHDIFGVR